MTELTLVLQIASEHTDLPDPELFDTWTELFSKEISGLSGEYGIRLVDEEESRQLNSDYRNKDTPTNVLSFPFEAPSGMPDDYEETYLGDLVICVPLVIAEAAQQNKPELHHWAHLVCHGLLHLCGYDHIDDADAEEMELLEVKILGKLQIPNPYN